jgi:hypothetical protein
MSKRQRDQAGATGPGGRGVYLDCVPERGLRPETQRAIIRLTEEAMAGCLPGL